MPLPPNPPPLQIKKPHPRHHIHLLEPQQQTRQPDQIAIHQRRRDLIAHKPQLDAVPLADELVMGQLLFPSAGHTRESRREHLDETREDIEARDERGMVVRNADCSSTVSEVDIEG